jgi:sec-independent protein translocase protein TatB
VFLFIFESIGTSELILVGIVALIFLGPRKLPEYARKIGKMMAEFRGTANEFKETWQREVNFEEEAKAFDIKNLDADPIARADSTSAAESADAPVAPEIKAIDPASFEHLQPAETAVETESAEASDKKNWL